MLVRRYGRERRSDPYMIRFETRLTILFAVFFIATVGLVLAVDMRTEHRLVDSVDRDLMNIINTIHFSSQKLSAEVGPDREALVKFIEEAKRNKAVREISVIGSTHEIIASSNPANVGQVRSLAGQAIIVAEGMGSKNPAGHMITYDIRVPLFRMDKVVGLVQAEIEVQDYRYLLRQLYLKNLLITAGIMVFAFALVLLTLSRLNRPLRRLIAASDRVASGDLTVRMEPETDDEVGRLTASFNVMTRKLAEEQELEVKLRLLERSAMLSEMASSVAHEIRNPLNLINLTADHLGMQYQPEDGERRKSFEELIVRVKAKVRQIDQMVTDILKIGRPLKLKRTNFTWNDLFEEVERSLKSQLVSKGVDVQFSGRTELSVNADREQMRLALSNLLMHALHSVEEKGRITVEIVQGNDGNGSTVAVADTGKGIPAEDLETIFEPYSAKHPGGTGLELALVRRVIEEHGGKIHAANTPGGGTRFEFTLPMEA